MRVLMLAALLLITKPAAAQNWVKVDETAEATFYLESGTVRVDDHLRRAWAIQDLKQRDPRTGGMSMRALHEYDCKEERHRGLSMTVHSEPMASGKVLVSLGSPSPWDHISPKPNTVAKNILTIVCGIRK